MPFPLSSRCLGLNLRPACCRWTRSNSSTRLLSQIAREVPLKPPSAQEGVPVFKDELLKEYPRFKAFREDVRRPVVWRQVIFFVIGSTALYGTMVGACEVDTKNMTRLLRGVTSWDVSSEEMRRARTYQLAEGFRDDLKRIHAATSQISTVVSRFVQWGYAKYAQAVVDASESKRWAWHICAANVAVWLLWQGPGFKPLMARYFMHNPLSGMSITLLTSMFSHQSFLHLLFNSLALSSFGAAAGAFLSNAQKESSSGLQESSVTYHLFAFYVTAGLFAGLSSHLASRVRFDRFIKKLGYSPLAVTPKQHGILPSLGASGAIYACVSMCALAFPTAQIALAIPPSFPIPITWGVGGMVCLDIIGILRGWRIFDHWAHLGGAAFGAAYYYIGPSFWDEWRIAAASASEETENNGKKE